MTRRLFWVAVGATAGILVARKVTRTAKRVSPPALVGSAQQAATDLLTEVRGFVADVRAISADRERELRQALGVAPERVG
jgi:hypothetical protein